MTNIKTVKIDLKEIPMSQRKYIGRYCEKCLASLGTVDDVRIMLRRYIDTHEHTDAATWLLARLTTDKLAEVNCRKYIHQLMYG